MYQIKVAIGTKSKLPKGIKSKVPFGKMDLVPLILVHFGNFDWYLWVTLILVAFGNFDLVPLGNFAFGTFG